jgi:hypothetical protein
MVTVPYCHTKPNQGAHMAVFKPIIASFFALSVLGIAALLDDVGSPRVAGSSPRADRLDLLAPQTGCLAGSMLSACANPNLAGAHRRRFSVVQVFERPGETELVRIDNGN